MRRCLSLLAAVFLTFAGRAAAQQPGPSQGAASASAIFVFLDCQDVGCDFDYFRTEITAVNWVRDRQAADVHILVTGQDNGGGGREFTLTFIGLRSYTGLTDTLKTSLGPNYTDDDRRVALAKVFRMGLVRYLARTTAASQVSVTLGDAQKESSQISTKADPWKAWVFSVGMNGFTFGDQHFKYYSMNGRFSANRVTAAWKTQFSGRENYNEERNTFQTEIPLDTLNPADTIQRYKDTTDVFIRRNFFFSFTQVKSVGAHMSVGLRSDLSSSTFENTRRSIRLAPAVEYSVFPYSQSTRRVLKAEYAIGVADFLYKDSTLYDKLKETRPLHRLQITSSQRQPWGQVDVSISGTQYLHDVSKYRVSGYGGVEVRLFKGFRLSFDGGYEDIHDQLSLIKRGLSSSELLLRRQQRGTTYSYNFSVGINYTFGSVLNNVVNPRFDNYNN